MSASLSLSLSLSLSYTHMYRCLTMPKLLQKMTLQAKVEAREGLRKLIFSFNGSAGLYILQEKVTVCVCVCVCVL